MGLSQTRTPSISFVKSLMTYTEANRRALLTLTSEKAFLASVGRILGWDIVVGQERFFSAPLWWVFKDVERSSLLVNSVELIKEFGFLYYFVQFGKSTALRNNVHSNFDITDRQGTGKSGTLCRMYVIAYVFYTIGVTNGSQIWYGMSRSTLFGGSSYRSLSVLFSVGVA